MDNRSNILKCALELFAARGYDAIGVQEICEAAGITKPTLYHYFGNKRGVLDSLVREQCGPFVTQLTQAADYNGDLPLTLQKMVTVYFQFALHHPAFYRMQLAMWIALPENEAFQVVAAANEEQHQIVEAMFLRATADHGNMRGRRRIYAATFIGMVNTYIALALNGYLELNDMVAQQAVHQFSHGIYS